MVEDPAGEYIQDRSGAFVSVHNEVGGRYKTIMDGHKRRRVGDATILKWPVPVAKD